MNYELVSCATSLAFFFCNIGLAFFVVVPWLVLHHPKQSLACSRPAVAAGM
jgi:hypothetical protein